MMMTKIVRKSVFLLVTLVLLLSFVAPVMADVGIPKAVDPKKTYGYIQYKLAFEAMDNLYLGSKISYSFEQYLKAMDAMDQVN